MNLPPSGKYTQLIELRIERDKLVNERNHIKAESNSAKVRKKYGKTKDVSSDKN